MGNPHNIKAGQTVYELVGSYSNHTRLIERTVKSVGRKYAHFDGWRNAKFNLETLVTYCGDYTGNRIYLTEQSYHDKVLLDRLWGNLVRRLSTSAPRADIETTRKIAQMLNLDIEGDA